MSTETANPWKGTLVEKLDRLPPCICRLLARRNGVLLTERELRTITGWSREKFWKISGARSWSKIPAGDADKFLFACGLTWSAQRTMRWYLQLATRRGLNGIQKMRHIQKAIEQRPGAVALLLRRTEKILRETIPSKP